MKVKVLGIDYSISYKNEKEDNELIGCDGYVNVDLKVIVISTLDDWNIEARPFRQKQALRHEITHAFLFESGLWGDSNSINHWAMNEEMVDWFATQSPKIFKSFQEVNCI